MVVKTRKSNGVRPDVWDGPTAGQLRKEQADLARGIEEARAEVARLGAELAKANHLIATYLPAGGDVEASLP